MRIICIKVSFMLYLNITIRREGVVPGVDRLDEEITG
jgi:hypothetical protein